MGEVYLALDSQLERPVALKILPAQIARDQPLWWTSPKPFHQRDAENNFNIGH